MSPSLLYIGVLFAAIYYPENPKTLSNPAAVAREDPCDMLVELDPDEETKTVAIPSFSETDTADPEKFIIVAVPTSED